MPKCIKSIEPIDQWSPVINSIDTQLEKALDKRDSELKEHLDSLNLDLLLDIICDFQRQKQSLKNEDFKLDCTELQSSLRRKLSTLQSNILSLVEHISKDPDVTASRLVRKHRTFMILSHWTTQKLHSLAQSIGRLSELDQSLYHEDLRNSFVSDESIVIHSIIMIWSSNVSILNAFCEAAPKVFNQSFEEDQEFFEDQQDLIEQLEFTKSHELFAKALLADLTATSWVKFNQLVVYEDLVKSLPFLCSCNCSLYYTLMKQIINKDKNFLSTLLQCVLGYEHKPSFSTLSIRQIGVLPFESVFTNSNQYDLAYFLVWHIYHISRIYKDVEFKQVIANNVLDLLPRSFVIAMKMFLSPMSLGTIQETSPIILSSHQKERFQLMFHMLNDLCERHLGSSTKLVASLVLEMCKFFDRHWLELGSVYFESSSMSVQNMTLYQLFVKLYSELQAKNRAINLDRTGEELNEVWDKLQTRLQPASGTKKVNETRLADDLDENRQRE